MAIDSTSYRRYPLGTEGGEACPACPACPVEGEAYSSKDLDRLEMVKEAIKATDDIKEIEDLLKA